MSSDKHSKSHDEEPFTSDLDRNPGIGQSEGSFATGEDPEELEGDNTVEGDVENDPTAARTADERKLGRTNR